MRQRFVYCSRILNQWVAYFVKENNHPKLGGYYSLIHQCDN
ncbi:hypothetical protein AO382_0229 [Moraxella catarrhalis]|uniref:Uncharacterized protein n=1 Tax=Moraxella catarrhalis TaxID=480 RepID=A0A7Z1A4L3_MORCA|nr:hypothetical protein AO382_0229 [Moraxella catarrhalis]